MENDRPSHGLAAGDGEVIQTEIWMEDEGADPLTTDGLLPTQSCLLDFIVLIGLVDGSAKSRILSQYRSRVPTRIVQKFRVPEATGGELADDAGTFHCTVPATVNGRDLKGCGLI